MHYARAHHLFLLLHILSGPSFSHGNGIDTRVLYVGDELLKETLPLKGGSCFYQLQGLKLQTWYEVKISYPASIPSSFSIQLKRGNFDMVTNHARKLLNTEKLIFKTDSTNLLSDQGKMYVLVSVEPEGVVAIPNAERKYVIYNIVCDELLLGIPHKAWWVAVLVLLCLAISFVIPLFLPTYLLPTNRIPQSPPQILSKDS